MVLIAAILAVAGAQADASGTLTALAMHGEPAYPATMSHFRYANPKADIGGDLRLTATGSFDSLNPYIIKGVPAQGLGLVYESLMERAQDEPFTLYPLIAEAVEVADDRSWIVFHVNPAARFQDGSPVTAADVLYTWRTLRDQGRPHTRTYYAEVVEATALDERTVRFAFREGNWEMPLIMGLMPVLSERYFAAHAFDRTSLDPPLGTGPYRVDVVQPGQRIVYRRDPGYWGWDLPVNRGRYNFARISFTYYRDATAALQAFLAGDADARFEDDATRWATAYGGPALDRGDIVMEEVAHGRPSGMPALVFNERREPFDDIRVREALGLAFDFAWTNANLLHGAYRRTTSMFDNSELAAAGLPEGAELALLEPYRADLPPELFTNIFTLPGTDGSGQLRHQLQAARDLLAQAGWQVVDGELIHTGDGRRFSFEILLEEPKWERILLPYVRNLERRRNYARWIEYSLSSSVMVVLIAMLVGIADVAALIAIAGVNASMILFGLLQEKYEDPDHKVSWVSYWFGVLAGAIPWIAIGIYLVAPGIDNSPPGFVYGIFFSLFAFFNVFAIVMVLQYKKVGRWADYRFGESTYVLLSLLAKSALAWQVFGGTLAV